MIGHIPAILWGENTGRLIIAIHGDQSHKEDAVIAILAEEADAKGYGVLSFDLPEHGDRKDDPELCKAQVCVPELRSVLIYVRTLAPDISLFGCSLGVYLSLAAYGGEVFRHALFLSPVVDMRRLIENMMSWFDVTPALLEAEGEIPTPMGKTLYWDYYRYVRDHPVDKWPIPTAILCGERDGVSEYDRVSAFASRFGAELTVMKDGEHFFHTDAQLAFFRRWLRERL
ncbi:alpha/beta hydrolase [Oscillospiraceae bacterium OttesenSCG-928-F05]|nr:alpha/beta hydrolase [Oscillospiraceae bacterium OttesenSCG-928-F05]